MRYFLKFNIKKSEISLNFDYDIILKDYIYLRKYLLDLKIKKITFFILIREINNKIDNINKYIIITIYIKDIINNIIKNNLFYNKNLYYK